MGRKRRDDEETGDAQASRYGDELLCANWNPVIELLEASCRRTAAAPRSERHALREEDVEGFLGRIYHAGS